MHKLIVLATLIIGLVGINSASDDDLHDAWPFLAQLKSNASENVQKVTVFGMIGRVLSPAFVALFDVVVNASLSGKGRDVFVLQSVNVNGTSKILISGNTGVAASAGFQYYLKEFCGCHVSWSGKQVFLPATLPVIPVPLKVVANDMFRYYQNVCTASYSFVWWDWKRWEQEIDWMALNWINLPLAFNGQEEIFRRVYLKLGFKQSDFDFFSGPAFLSWSRMGNIDSFGGPLPRRWYKRQLKLQHFILRRMRDFGMIPVLPAFSGHVPRNILKRFPNVNVTRLDDWNNFGDKYCCTYLLDHNEPLFQIIGSSFIKEMINEFGVDHVYNTDTFNEMTPLSNETTYVSSVGQAVFNAMVTADPKAVWLMQGWLFLDPYWTPDLARAFLTSVPIGRMLVLDLRSDLIPLYQNFESYYGQPFIWCMLHNFGGTNGLYGAVDNINEGPFHGRSFTNSTMVGTGLTPEGIEQNDVMYELMNEMAWRKLPVNLSVWIVDYAVRRYGVNNDNVTLAWQNLIHSAYNCSSDFFYRGQYVLVERPAFHRTPRKQRCYDKQVVLKAWTTLAITSFYDKALAASDLFRHDLADVTREVFVAIIASDMHDSLVEAFKAKNLDRYWQISQLFLDNLLDVDRLLASDSRFLLGAWLESAKQLAEDETEEELYEYNARNQITLWGPRGEIVDYAVKQWSGIFSDYFYPRWSLFFNQTWSALNSSKPFDPAAFKVDVFNQVEKPFTFSRKNFPTTTVDSVINVVFYLHEKWVTKLSLINCANDSDVNLVLVQNVPIVYSPFYHSSLTVWEDHIMH